MSMRRGKGRISLIRIVILSVISYFNSGLMISQDVDSHKLLDFEKS